MGILAGYLEILRSRLFARYALLIAITICGLLAAMAAFQIREAWTENVSRSRALLAEQAAATAARIQEHLAGIERQLQGVAGLPWAAPGFDPKERAFEYGRLQRIIPALTELRSIDADRREVVRVSQLAPNAIGSGEAIDSEIPMADDKAPRYGNAIFRGGVDPYAWVSFREAAGTGETAALVNMKFISDFIGQMRFGETGHAFVVDGSGHVIAHPDIRLVLRRLNVSGFPDVASAIASGASRHSGSGRSIDGTVSEFSASRIGTTGWWTFVQQSRDEMLGPVRTAALRGIILTLIGLLWAAALALWLARHLSSPILQLRRAAARIGEGDLQARAVVGTSDEIKGLADEFNGMAERLQESYAQLEAKVEARTRELAEANVELGKRKEEADEANAAKTRFLASASHDLRQPMHAIGLLVGILNEQVKEADARAIVEKVQGSVEAMDRLFASLLDISKLDAGAVKPHMANVEVGNVLRSIAVNFGPLAEAKKLKFRIAATHAVVRSDAALLERIVGNLVSNAIRYTSSGGLLVGCRRRGDVLLLQVSDTGPGIPPEHLDNIFAEFFQLEGARDRNLGLGLGLSIVKRTAELLGHPISVRSRSGRGSTFTIELPLVKGPPAPAEERGGMRSNALEGAFVVALDDDPLNRFATETLLRQWHCDVLAGDSTESVVGALEGRLRSPDLLITDLRLGDGDSGLVAIERVNALAGRTVPAILVTGDVLVAAEARKAQEAGVVLLHKPVDPEELRRVAERLLSA